MERMEKGKSLIKLKKRKEENTRRE